MTTLQGHFIEDVIERTSLRFGLLLLNAQSPYRYTVLHLTDGFAASQQFFIDRETPDAKPSLSSMPLGALYCAFPFRSGRLHVITDASDDPRTKRNPLSEIFRGYAGVPVTQGAGRPIGTLCHFDHDPVVPSEQVCKDLERIAGLIGMLPILLR